MTFTVMQTMSTNPPIAAVICTPSSCGSSVKHTMAKAPAHLLSHANGWCGKQLTSLCISSLDFLPWNQIQTSIVIHTR